MKKQNIVIKTLKNRIRKQEDKWKTKKASKALITVALTILIILTFETIIEQVQAFQSTPIEIDNSSRWVARQEVASEQLKGVQEKDNTDDGSLVEEKIRQAFPEAPEIMIAVAKAESGLNPTATHTNRNGSTDTGLFQVNSIHGYEQLTDVDKNIEAARKIFEKQGLSAWAVIKSGVYLKYL